jgi:hypothetical protein
MQQYGIASASLLPLHGSGRCHKYPVKELNVTVRSQPGVPRLAAAAPATAALSTAAATSVYS